jgi:hypothetical protein
VTLEREGEQRPHVVGDADVGAEGAPLGRDVGDDDRRAFGR